MCASSPGRVPQPKVKRPAFVARCVSSGTRAESRHEGPCAHAQGYGYAARKSLHRSPLREQRDRSTMIPTKVPASSAVAKPVADRLRRAPSKLR